MSTDPDNVRRLAPAWNEHRVAVVAGQHDTHIATGEDYETRTLASLFALDPGNAPKLDGLAFIPSTYHDYDARSHAAQRTEGRFVALCGDVDKGNHPLDRIETMVRGFVGEAAWLIFSTAHARPEDMRWRIVIPLAQPLSFDDWHDAQNAFFALMEYGGVEMDHALDRAGQLVYLPNVPAVHAKTGTALRDEAGAPLFYRRATTGTSAPGLRTDEGQIASGIEAIVRKRQEDERERERIRAEAERRRANRPHSDDAPILEDFNRTNPIANLLELYGYKQSPRHPEDWRSPHQTGESYATRIMGEKWVSLSASDVAARVGEKCAAGCFGDAYDLFAHYEHGGDHKAAFRALYQERRASQPSPSSAPPPPQPDDPGPEPEDFGEEEPAEEDFVLPEGVQHSIVAEDFRRTSGSILAYEWAGKTTPVIDGFWLIDDWLPKIGIAAVYGHPGCGKSFFVLHMGVHVAAGRQWAGKHVEKGLVIYVVAEGQSGFRNRLFAMQETGEIPSDLPFAFIPTAIDLQAEKGDVENLIATIRAAVEEAGIPVAMVVIDTLSKTFGAGKENTDDMVPYINNCQRVASAFECLTVIVHHRPKDSESRDLRGHSSLRGNIDTAILVEAGPIKVATTLKQKDGEDNLQVRFELERVVIGEDRRGKEVSTCLVKLTDEAPKAHKYTPVEQKKRRLKGHKKTAFRIIECAVAKDGVEPPMGIPGDIIDRFKSHYAIELGQISDKIENELIGVVTGDPDKKADTAKRTAKRALADLKSDGVIGTWKEWVWVNF